ncbi:hypothetical protein [Nonomuraea recticatena]|uniref:hypothetical protein n=1 Tax=Nonomuraea recticatena TaxID=46178 RepID=UPI00361C2FC2
MVAVQRVWSGRSRPPVRTGLRYPESAVSYAEHVWAAGRDAALSLTWREGSKGDLSSQFVFLRVRPAGHRVARDRDGTLPERWLIAQWPWPHDATEPVKYRRHQLGDRRHGVPLADAMTINARRIRTESRLSRRTSRCSVCPS